MACIHHYNVMQHINTALEIPCALAIHLYLLLSLAITDLFTVSIVLPFTEWHIIRVILYVDFLDSPLSISNVHLRLLHAFSWIDNAFLYSVD